MKKIISMISAVLVMIAFSSPFTSIAKSAELNVDNQIKACNSISCRGPDSQGLVLGSSINQKINYIQSNNVNYGNSKS